MPELFGEIRNVKYIFSKYEGITTPTIELTIDNTNYTIRADIANSWAQSLVSNSMQKAEFIDLDGKVLPSKIKDLSISQIQGLVATLNQLDTMCRSSYCNVVYNELTHRVLFTKNDGTQSKVDLYSIIEQILGGSVPEALDTLHEIAEWINSTTEDFATALAAITITDHRSWYGIKI